MLLVGDIYVQRDEPAGVFRHVAETLRQADLVIGNLEGAVANSGTPWPKGGATTWKADARQIAAVASGGFHALTVANNHMLDFGYDALFETLASLDRCRIAHAGGGRNLAEAHAPVLLRRGDCTVAVLAYTSVFVDGWGATPERPGLAVLPARTSYEPPSRILEVPGSPPIIHSCLTPDAKLRLRADLEAAKRAADIVVCAFHWGVSHGFRNLTEYQVELGRLAVDEGADLVVGHHPHLLQGIEVYRSRAIFYSLGNFTFARHNSARGQELETLVARCRIEGKRIAAVEFLPATCDEDLDPRIPSGSRRQAVVALVAARSAQFNTRFVAAGDAIGIALGTT